MFYEMNIKLKSISIDMINAIQSGLKNRRRNLNSNVFDDVRNNYQYSAHGISLNTLGVKEQPIA